MDMRFICILSVTRKSQKEIKREETWMRENEEMHEIKGEKIWSWRIGDNLSHVLWKTSGIILWWTGRKQAVESWIVYISFSHFCLRTSYQYPISHYKRKQEKGMFSNIIPANHSSIPRCFLSSSSREEIKERVCTFFKLFLLFFFMFFFLTCMVSCNTTHIPSYPTLAIPSFGPFHSSFLPEYQWKNKNETPLKSWQLEI